MSGWVGSACWQVGVLSDLWVFYLHESSGFWPITGGLPSRSQLCALAFRTHGAVQGAGVAWGFVFVRVSPSPCPTFAKLTTGIYTMKHRPAHVGRIHFRGGAFALCNEMEAVSYC